MIMMGEGKKDFVFATKNKLSRFETVTLFFLTVLDCLFFFFTNLSSHHLGSVTEVTKTASGWGHEACVPSRSMQNWFVTHFEVIMSHEMFKWPRIRLHDFNRLMLVYGMEVEVVVEAVDFFWQILDVHEVRLGARVVVLWFRRGTKHFPACVLLSAVLAVKRYQISWLDWRQLTWQSSQTSHASLLRSKSNLFLETSFVRPPLKNVSEAELIWNFSNHVATVAKTSGEKSPCELARIRGQ